MDERWREPLVILTIVLVVIAAVGLCFQALPHFEPHAETMILTTSNTLTTASTFTTVSTLTSASTLTTSVTFTTTSTASSVRISTSNFQYLSIRIVKPDPNNNSAWISILSNGEMTRYAKLEKGKATPFLLNITNTGSSDLHLLGISFQFTYPNGNASDIFTGGVPYTLTHGQSTSVPFTYGTNLPTFQGGFGQVVFVVYGENNEWAKSITIPLAY